LRPVDVAAGDAAQCDLWFPPKKTRKRRNGFSETG
jgi:hypothetical protein